MTQKEQKNVVLYTYRNAVGTMGAVFAYIWKLETSSFQEGDTSQKDATKSIDDMFLSPIAQTTIRAIWNTGAFVSLYPLGGREAFCVDIRAVEGLLCAVREATGADVRKAGLEALAFNPERKTIQETNSQKTSLNNMFRESVAVEGTPFVITVEVRLASTHRKGYIARVFVERKRRLLADGFHYG
ncbi:MAG: hypothetical protein HGB03_01565 [Candidatus Yonathbacteria bacterium]|nr:hypothetical protein [Candidatus Yonathbacteria bacterium]NTW47952.1 hypothetical protein [Candidatus Yonathbacteria bacterium]